MSTHWQDPINGYPTPPPPVAPKKKRHIFRWVFLAIQILFLIWVISAGVSASGTPDDCGTLDAATCNDAESIGAGIGIALILVFWVIVDVILALTYLIFRKK